MDYITEILDIKDALLKENWLPYCVRNKNDIYYVSDWEELYKLAMYYLDNENSKFAEYNFTHQSDNKIINDNPNELFNGKEVDYVKFSKRLYIRVFANNRNRVGLLKELKTKYKNKNIEIYLFDGNLCDKKIIEDENEKFIKHVNDLGLKTKSTKRAIGKINSIILNDKEKFEQRIAKEFPKYTYLSDIYLNDNEIKLLKDFMNKELRSLLINVNKYKPRNDQLFALGLVYTAMNHYDEGRFWPYLEEDYGYNITGYYQTRINDIFKSIMIKNHKKYFDEQNNVIQKIDNISYHAFCTNKYSDKFFDLIFRFWNNELNRNQENMYENSQDNVFDTFIEQLKINKYLLIKTHIVLAIKANENLAKRRIRRIIKAIDSTFFSRDKAINKDSKNRLISQFAKWIDNPKSEFNKVLLRVTRNRSDYKRGEKIYTSPKIDIIRDQFVLTLPQIPIRSYDESKTYSWEVYNGDETYKQDAILKYGSVFILTEQSRLVLNPMNIFKSLTVVLVTNDGKIVHSYKNVLEEAEYRFFNSKYAYINVDQVKLTDGDVICISQNDSFPHLLRNYNSSSYSYNGLFRKDYNLKNGDILIFNDNSTIQIGNKITEGILHDCLLKNAHIKTTDNIYKIYYNVPKILLSLTSPELNGGLFILNGKIIGKLNAISCQMLLLNEKVSNKKSYIFELDEYIKNNGLYEISISLPNKKFVNYSFYYLNDIEFEFKKRCYIFNNDISVSFKKTNNLIIDSDWEENSDKLELNINLLNIKDYNSISINDRKLILKYKQDNSVLDLLVDLPILFWKTRKEDEWYFSKPARVFYNEMPHKLYISAPFKHLDENNYIFIDDEEKTITGKIEDDYYVFNITNISAYFDDDEASHILYLNTDFYNSNIALQHILLHSLVNRANVSADLETNTLYGKFDIIGNLSYCVSIFRDDRLLYEYIDINDDGTFCIKTDYIDMNGKYVARIFELNENDFIPSYDQIGKDIDIKLFSFEILEHRSLEIDSIRVKDKKIEEFKLQNSYKICDIVRLRDYKKEGFVSTLKKWFSKQYIKQLNIENIDGFEVFRGTIVCDNDIIAPVSRKDSQVYVLFNDMYNKSKVVIFKADINNFIAHGKLKTAYKPTDINMLLTNNKCKLMLDPNIKINKNNRHKYITLFVDAYDFYIKLV